MQIRKDFLTINEYSRPGSAVRAVTALVIVSGEGESATGFRHRFEERKAGGRGHGSAHYIIDVSGEILQCIPEEEVSYHCRSRKYTTFARSLFGTFATSDLSSPDFYTIAVLLCRASGNIALSNDTFYAAVELAACLCRRYQLDPGFQITTHRSIHGLEAPPCYWVDHPGEFQRFVFAVTRLL